MSNLFDDKEERLFNRAGRVFGYHATWTPSAGGTSYTARVLFNRPSEVQRVYDVEYDPTAYFMEYFEGDFPGLKAAADARLDEHVTIQGVEYFIREVKAIWDGKTYKAVMELKS